MLDSLIAFAHLARARLPCIDIPLSPCYTRRIGRELAYHSAEQVGPKMRHVVVLATLLLGLLSGLAACNQTSTATTPTAAHQTNLPSFPDWRVGYIDDQAHVHAESVDGKHDIAGSLTLQGLNRAGNHVAPATFSPSGTLLAYPPDPLQTFGFTVVDATGKKAAMYEPGLSYTLHWSFDSNHLAVGDGDGVQILNVSQGTLTTVPLSSSVLISSVLGWTDADHLVVIARSPSSVPTPAPNSTPVSSGGPSSGPNVTTLYVLDVVSGALRSFVTVSSTTSEQPDFVLSPDGQTVLYDNRPFRDEPFTPDVGIIDVKTGAVTHLPHVAAATQAWFSGVAFLPSTRTIAVSQGDFLTGKFRTWLLDTPHDSLTPLDANQGVAVGWVPSTHTLILSSGTVASESIGQGPYTISAVPDPLSNPQAAAITLTTHAMTFPWLGFVKTA